MSLEAGRRLGVYEILSPLGAGGMGEVYRARDTRLGREVAIKVLPADRLTDEARRRRFVQEARAASALNHPNIVTIHEIESADGADFIVMEHVPGRTLDALIRPRMRLADALRVAIQIADALARAHAAGIVHRDLKPANVIVTREGVAKVLDFGLAKLVATDDVSHEQEVPTAETLERFVSGTGMAAGTPGYMSPEQATGGHVDARSDIFAFGSLLYEMVTGRRAFAASSLAGTLEAVLHLQPPPPRTVVADLPADLEKLVLRLLRKEPERRFQHMADVKVALEEIAEDPTAGSTAGKAAGARGAGPRRFAVAVAVALAVALGFWAARRALRPAGPPPRVVALTATSGYEGWPTFSPDGSQIAFQWDGEVAEGTSGAPRNTDIWLKLVGSSETRRLTTDPAADCCPSWSPDGRQIAFLRLSAPDASRSAQASSIYLVSPISGVERRLSDITAESASGSPLWTGTSGLDWTPDGRWLVTSSFRGRGRSPTGAGALQAVSLDSGEAHAITTPPAAGYDANPALSRDGRRLAYASCRFWWLPPCDLEIVDVGPDLVTRAEPRRLARLATRVGSVAFARDGRSVLYSVVPNVPDSSRLFRISVSGARPPERLELAPEGAVSVAVSPAQDRLAFTLERSGYSNIFRFEPGRPLRQLAASPGGDNSPSFSPDGRRIAFMSARSGEGMEIWLSDSDGSNAVQLTRGPGSHQGSPRFSPDGRRIAFESRGEDGFADVWTIDVAGGRPRRVTDSAFHAGRSSWSPEGRFLYHRQDREDGSDIVRTPAEGGPTVRVTRDGGFVARPSADGRWLFYAKTGPEAPLFRIELPAGPEQQLVDCMQTVSLESGPQGIYYAGCVEPGSGAPLYRLKPASGRIQLLGHFPAERSQVSGLAVSPVGETILFASQLPKRADLFLIENFR